MLCKPEKNTREGVMAQHRSSSAALATPPAIAMNSVAANNYCSPFHHSHRSMTSATMAVQGTLTSVPGAAAGARLSNAYQERMEPIGVAEDGDGSGQGVGGSREFQLHF